MKTFICILALLLPGVALAGQNVVVVFDDSGSMSESMGSEQKLDAAKRGVLKVLETLPEDSNVGIVGLNTGWRLNLQTHTRQEVADAVTSIPAGGGTPLGRAMQVGGDELLKLRDKQKYGTYRLLVVTDGVEGDRDLVTKITDDLLTRNVYLDVVGVMMPQEHQLAKKARTYRNVTDAASLEGALKQALAETPVKLNNEESDFDLIAPLPDQLAKDTLQALTVTDNRPLGSERQAEQGEQAAASPAVASGSSAGMICLMIGGGVLGVIFVIWLASVILDG
jgi:hypothetical protein